MSDHSKIKFVVDYELSHAFDNPQSKIIVEFRQSNGFQKVKVTEDGRVRIRTFYQGTEFFNEFQGMIHREFVIAQMVLEGITHAEIAEFFRSTTPKMAKEIRMIRLGRNDLEGVKRLKPLRVNGVSKDPVQQQQMDNDILDAM